MSTPPVSAAITIDDSVTLDCRIAGPADGERVLLLHGFPDFSHGWRHQIAAFAANGYRVIAPDLHGYAGSSKPRDLERYRLGNIARDVVRLMELQGGGPFHVVGHDWGAALTWRVAADFPERLRSVTVMCVPHLQVFFDHIRRNRHGQALRSWYMAFFQLPWLPERLFAIRGGRWLAGVLAKSARRGTFSAEDEALYAEAWSRPGAPTAMLNWYRANLRRGNRRQDAQAGGSRKIRPRTLILWGDRDAALNHHMAEDSLKWCENGRVHHFPKGSHWVHMEFPAEVNQLILTHLKDLS